MKISLAQIAPRLGDAQKNFELHLECIRKARKKRASLIVFPELSLTGYTLMDMVPEVALNPATAPVFSELKTLSKEIDIVLGFVEEKDPGLFTNSAAYLSGGKILHLHRKVFLPTYGIFEEAKFFAQGKAFRTFETQFGKAGLSICRDFLTFASSYLLFVGGAEIMIIISAAPGRGMSPKEGFVTSRMWELMGEAVSFFASSFVVYCNRVGFEDGKAFAGGSFIFSPMGKILVRAASVDSDQVFADLNLDELRAARQKFNFKRDDRPELILQDLKRIVHEDEN